jgi:hypothetical protein
LAANNFNRVDAAGQSAGAEELRSIAIGSGKLERVVAHLKEIERRTGLERTLAIGELVLTQFFAGNPAAWRARGRNKDHSVRQLASHADCPFGKSALHEAVGVYVAMRAMPNVRTLGHITASHVASVLRLAENQRQAMLEQAEHEHWGVRELRQAVVNLRRAEGERRGRPVEASQVRALSALRASVRTASRVLVRVERTGSLSARTRTEMLSLARETARLTDALTALAHPP